MKELYKYQIDFSESMPSESERFNYRSAILRSIMQAAAIVSFEVVRALAPLSSNDADVDYLIKRFEQPSDGLPLDVLDALVPIVRGQISKTFMTGWFERSSETDMPLAQEILAWVEFRNKKPAHGVVDRNDAALWSEKLLGLSRRCLEVFSVALPELKEDGSLSLQNFEDGFVIETPLVSSGKPIVINRVVARKGVWKLHAQLLSWDSASDVTINLSGKPVFATSDSIEASRFSLREIKISDSIGSVFHNIPVRQTDIFEGRAKELQALESWINEGDDSRFCLIYGDGGYGKTTLALEFLNRILEGEVNVGGVLPSLICYYTAKMTRWTDEGIVHFKGISSAMDDCVREIMYCIYPVLGKDWFRLSGAPLVDRVVGELAAQGFNRNDVVLVLDNTETLATSQTEVDDLSSFLRKIGKSLGRVIITSRRREFLPAIPLQVSSMPEEEAVRLMVRLGREYNAVAINQAGEARLRKVCRSLLFKPLFIDTLVKYIARSSSGIDDALDQILKKNNDELLEFLYQDAWLRMGELQRQVFLVLVKVVTPINGHCVGDVCGMVGVPHVEFQAGLDETYFATLTDYGDGYDLEIVELAKQFFRKQFSKLGADEKARIVGIAADVDAHAISREKIEREYISDRVADAFRNQYAKAAKIASERGDAKMARENFELALLEEPMNAALHDRYAWFVLNRLQLPEEAKPLAEKAVELDPLSADASLTLALVYYRLNDIESGDVEISSANKKGKPASLCSLRSGIARFYKAKNIVDPVVARNTLDEAERMIRYSMNSGDPESRYFDKNRKEAQKFLVLIDGLRYRINQRDNVAKGAF